MQALRSMSWQAGKITTDQPLSGLRERVRDQQALVWIDIMGAVAPYEAFLSGTFGLAKLVLQTIDEEAERAKFVERNGYCYMVIHGLEYDVQTDTARTPALDIVFGKNFLITAHPDPLAWLDDVYQEIAAQEADAQIMSRGVGFLLYEILDHHVDSFFPVLDDIDDIIDELEDVTVSNTSNEVQVRIFRIKRSLAQMRRVISPQVEVANSLRARADHLLAPEVQPYLGDVHDHLIRAFEILDSYRDLMSGLLDVYLTTVSNRLNAIMKQLAIVATIFLPITFITGLFGQNFGHSPQVEHDSGYNFWIVLGVMVIITIGQIWYFKRRGWI